MKPKKKRRAPALRVPKAHPHTGSDGKTRARIRIPGRKDQYLGEWGSPEALDAERRAVAEYLSQQAAPAPSGRRGENLSALLVAFARHAETWYREGGQPTGELYHYRAIVPMMREVGGDGLAAGFGVAELLECQRRFVALGWARTHCNEQTSRVRRVIRKGVEWGFCPASQLAELKAVAPLVEGKTTAPEREPVREVDDETVLRTLPYLGTSIAAMVLVERLTGMRPGEVVKLRACDLDRTADPHGDCWLYAPHQHKTKRQGKGRHIWLGPLVQRILTPLVAAAEERGQGGYLFPPTLLRRASRVQGRYLVSSYQRRIKYAVERRNRKNPDAVPLESWAPGQLRHARLTAVTLTHGMLTAQATGSHARLDTTAIYSHGQDVLAKQAASASG